MRIGRYELFHLVGAGGQGRVYEARWHGPAGFVRRVAVKLVSDGEGLVREARLGGLLRHPNLVDVFEVGEVDGHWFLAMEYAPGGSLADHLPLSPREVVEVGLQVCAALQYAHDELGLVHGDLKPGNLLLDGAVVKVADLGLARGDGAAPRKHRIEGTRRYMAPEQLRGDGVDARTDIYALGTVLQDLLSGEVEPSETSDLDTLSDDPDGAEPRASYEVHWLAPVLERCLAPDPDDRFPSMNALAAALRTLDVPPSGSLAERALRKIGTLPPPVAAVGSRSELVGRDEDLAALAVWLVAPGVVTLKGPPGIGKTALAREASERACARGEPSWFCDLAGARTTADVGALVARQLEVILDHGDDAAQIEVLARALEARGDALLVLDNVEHLVAVVILVVERLRHHARRLRILVTSRVALRCSDERVRDVGVLPEAHAVELLRACAGRRGVELGEDDARALAHRLDGLPLALELAAGRLGVLPVAEVLERLSLSLLRSGSASASDREATLRGALQWSWDLLEAPARVALADLSVFRGSFTLVAAAEVASPGEGSIADVLQDLLDRSLVATSDGRLKLLEPIREFATAYLYDPELAEVRHGSWFARLGSEDAVSALQERDAGPKRAELIADLANLEVACHRAVHRDDSALALATCWAAWGALELVGPFGRGADLAGEVAKLPGLRGRDLARALLVAGRASTAAGRFETAEVLLVRALEVARGAPEAGDLVPEILLDTSRLMRHLGRFALARETAEAAAVRVAPHAARGVTAPAYTVLAGLAVETGHSEEAIGRCEQALVLYESAGDRRGLATTRRTLGNALQRVGRVDEARASYGIALEIYREEGDRRGEAAVLSNLAVLEHHPGRHPLARAHHESALALYRHVGDRWGEANVLGNLAILDQSADRVDDALRGYDQALAIHREVGSRRGEGLTLGNVGAMLYDLGRLDESLVALAAALDVHREVGARRSEGSTLERMGDLLSDLGRTDEAFLRARSAVAVLRDVDDPTKLTEALALQGNLARELGDLGGALAAIEEALAIADRLHDPTLLAAIRGDLARVVALSGDPARSRALIREACATMDASDSLKLRSLIRADLACLEHDLGDPIAAHAAIAEAEAIASGLEPPVPPVVRRVIDRARAYLTKR